MSRVFENEYILAISVAHNSTAAVMKNGKILAAVCEERSKRKKNFIGFPVESIKLCLEMAGVSGKDLSKVAFCYTLFETLRSLVFEFQGCF